ncbi:BLUF domain-containing protein [Zobellia sp. 1_MG-2023]|uniref:BLUF domain-containing protein n=1 Tax=Zobellia sp. 1_MG-2023 TaxID=3062626 RepID=UPI0026E21A96|nr:BLUF domain-containing protein [Zobellia sp. 1_MG-2023]MDO6821328.1 BLUF domain-containing protein [Zobellia sp. 1_MG-2023]
MYTLTYESVAIPELNDRDIENILETARAFNSKHGITGCLIYHSGRFVQILEGPEEKVKYLYASIEKDNRHTKLNLFSEDNISERNFPHWGMAYYSVDEKNRGKSDLAQFNRNLTLLADLSKPTNVTAILFWKKMKSLISIPPSKTNN